MLGVSHDPNVHDEQGMFISFLAQAANKGVVWAPKLRILRTSS
jgi:hypothetical protein